MSSLNSRSLIFVSAFLLGYTSLLMCNRNKPSETPEHHKVEQIRDAQVVDTVRDEPVVDSSSVEDAATDVGVDAPTVCQRSCEILNKLNCPEGDEGCEALCEQVMRTQLIKYDPLCIMESETVTDVRKCPSIRCPLE